MTDPKSEKIAKLCGEFTVILTSTILALAFKTWLLTLILGWLGITALGFWKAMVVIILIDLLLNMPKSSK